MTTFDNKKVIVRGDRSGVFFGTLASRQGRELHPDSDKPIPARELFDWHHTLTGSCEMGRRQFCDERGIDIDNGEYSVRQFVELTSASYGSDAIKALAKEYGITIKPNKQ